MVRDATHLAERIKELDKKAKLDNICTLMLEYGISVGDIVEYANVHGSTIKTCAERLREINQTRKQGRQRLLSQQENIKKAQQAKKEKREQLLAHGTSSNVPTPELSVNLNLDDVALEVPGDF